MVHPDFKRPYPGFTVSEYAQGVPRACRAPVCPGSWSTTRGPPRVPQAGPTSMSPGQNVPRLHTGSARVPLGSTDGLNRVHLFHPMSTQGPLKVDPEPIQTPRGSPVQCVPTVCPKFTASPPGLQTESTQRLPRSGWALSSLQPSIPSRTQSARRFKPSPPPPPSKAQRAWRVSEVRRNEPSLSEVRRSGPSVWAQEARGAGPPLITQAPFAHTERRVRQEAAKSLLLLPAAPRMGDVHTGSAGHGRRSHRVRHAWEAFTLSASRSGGVHTECVTSCRSSH